jgi:hypothetical protein
MQSNITLYSVTAGWVNIYPQVEQGYVRKRFVLRVAAGTGRELHQDLKVPQEPVSIPQINEH